MKKLLVLSLVLLSGCSSADDSDILGASEEWTAAAEETAAAN